MYSIYCKRVPSHGRCYSFLLFFSVHLIYKKQSPCTIKIDKLYGDFTCMRTKCTDSVHLELTVQLLYSYAILSDFESAASRFLEELYWLQWTISIILVVGMWSRIVRKKSRGNWFGKLKIFFRNKRAQNPGRNSSYYSTRIQDPGCEQFFAKCFAVSPFSKENKFKTKRIALF